MAWFDPDLRVRNPDFSFVGAEHTLGGQENKFRSKSHSVENYCSSGRKVLYVGKTLAMHHFRADEIQMLCNLFLKQVPRHVKI